MFGTSRRLCGPSVENCFPMSSTRCIPSTGPLTSQLMRLFRQRDKPQPEMETLVAVRDELASATEQAISERFPPAVTVTTPIRSRHITGNEPLTRAIVVILLGLVGVLAGGLDYIRQL